MFNAITRNELSGTHLLSEAVIAAATQSQIKRPTPCHGYMSSTSFSKS